MVILLLKMHNTLEMEACMQHMILQKKCFSNRKEKKMKEKKKKEEKKRKEKKKNKD